MNNSLCGHFYSEIRGIFPKFSSPLSSSVWSLCWWVWGCVCTGGRYLATGMLCKVTRLDVVAGPMRERLGCSTSCLLWPHPLSFHFIYTDATTFGGSWELEALVQLFPLPFCQHCVAVMEEVEVKGNNKDCLRIIHFRVQYTIIKIYFGILFLG